ncbi:MAG: hypothetical protein HOQ33_22020 [Cupriavidus sp.]|nr:hypothetical protein [Cupriavidus sp.]
MLLSRVGAGGRAWRVGASGWLAGAAEGPDGAIFGASVTGFACCAASAASAPGATGAGATGNDDAGTTGAGGAGASEATFAVDAAGSAPCCTGAAFSSTGIAGTGTSVNVACACVLACSPAVCCTASASSDSCGGCACSCACSGACAGGTVRASFDADGIQGTGSPCCGSPAGGAAAPDAPGPDHRCSRTSTLLASSQNATAAATAKATADNITTNASLFFVASQRPNAGACAVTAATDAFPASDGRCTPALSAIAKALAWGVLANVRADALACVRAAASWCVNLREGVPAAVLAKVRTPASIAGLSRLGPMAGSCTVLAVAASGSAGLPAAISVAQGVGAWRSSNGAVASAEVRTPPNLPAHPVQYRARSLFGVWHASQYLVMVMASEVRVH